TVENKGLHAISGVGSISYLIVTDVTIHSRINIRNRLVVLARKSLFLILIQTCEAGTPPNSANPACVAGGRSLRSKRDLRLLGGGL
ncbi:MAG: hypothetical protein LUD16_08605, partial [Lachnospiraceae bacterium]|nr:hypothetical protein [Lachnospiraceae bacterium]